MNERDIDVETIAREGAPGAHPHFDALVRTIWRLRQPDGCPWDKAQTNASIAKHLIEESYEAVEAIREGDVEHMAEELGDVLENVILQAQIADDEGLFSIDDVCRALNEKLIRRHPHVFGEIGAKRAPEGADEVLDIWDEVKRSEREAQTEAGASGDEPGLLDSVPVSLPALMQCQKISKRAAKCGFEWETTADVWEKVAEERAEFEREGRGTPEAAAEFGDLLFALVNVARKEGIDAEEALATSNAKFRRRWSAVEELARERGSHVEELSTDELNVLWDLVKAGEKNPQAPSCP